MPRLFVVFRTFDRIWECKTYTRELALFEMDMSEGPMKFMFVVDQLTVAPNGKDIFALDYLSAKHNIFSPTDPSSFYCHAHENFRPVIVKPSKQEPTVSPTGRVQRGLVRRYSVPSLELDLVGQAVSDQLQPQEVIYYVLPMYRCTVMMDAHLASCVNYEYTSSRAFRRHFWRYLCKRSGFRNCVPDYEKWTQEERDAWDNYLSVPYMIDIVAVWPKQKIDYAWSKRILGLVNKHVVLEEGFAWLSTLGGAHSSLGETFIHHAEQAGKISAKQLRLAIRLGNESLIARCYIFWSWSLLQRGQLRRCRTCVLNTWKFSQAIRTRDLALENMCKAVWCRLRYKLAQLKARSRRCLQSRNRSSLDKDDENGGGDRSSNLRSSIVPRNSNIGKSSAGDITNKNSSSVCIETTVRAHSIVPTSLCVH